MAMNDLNSPNQTISVRMPRMMLKHINSQAGMLGVDRSRLVRHLIRAGSRELLKVDLDTSP